MQTIDFEQSIDFEVSSTKDYQTLRTNIELSGKNIKAIGVTSCKAGEGKTFVAMHLAIALAKAGYDVLFVDADLRNSVLADTCQIEKESKGLSHYLCGKCSLPDIVYATNFLKLHTIVAGVMPSNPVELLGNPEFLKVLEFGKLNYDYIIMDTPALERGSDSTIIMKECDGTILVIESKALSYKVVQKEKAQLERNGCKILGAVLNKVV